MPPQNHNHEEGEGALTQRSIVDTGNGAAALAAKMARAQVIPSFPITPQTTIVEKLASYVAKGELKARYVEVESEHSMMAVCIGAAATGARTFTATSSHGLTYMHEMLRWASFSRLPVVMAVGNRALGPGWNIWADLTDSLSQRDTGWIQIYCSDNQEVFDSILQAYKFSEDGRVLLPTMVCLESLILTHTSMPFTVPDQESVDGFIPLPEQTGWALNVEEPVTHGNIITPDFYMEFSKIIEDAMEEARRVVVEVDEEYGRRFGFKHGGLVEKYRCEDAKVVAICMGSMASEMKLAIDHLREEGYRAGLARVRVFRPFPHQEIQRLKADAFAVIDRGFSPGQNGILHSEVRDALYGVDGKKPLRGFIAGLGGREVTSLDLEEILKATFRSLEAGDHKLQSEWYGLKKVWKMQEPEAIGTA